MNAVIHTRIRPIGRLVELSPFEVGLEDRTASAPPASEGRGAAVHSEDESFGCVDWYQYPAGRRPHARAARAGLD
jgi:hypothetical protein